MSVDFFELDSIPNGEYLFDKHSFKVENFDRVFLSSSILICFSGAVANRIDKTGPFYSGAGIAGLLKIPTVMIADTSVTYNKNISLGWYIGSNEFMDFQHSIASFLDKLSFRFNKKLIILGGSGGGFAGLACCTRLKARSFLIAMNPQTIISKYYAKSVNNYLKNSFSGNSLNHTNCDDFFNNNNIICDVANAEFSNSCEILYLQNKSDDHHISNHLSPFIKRLKLFPMGDNSYIVNNLAFYLGDWGDGHIPPSRDIIISIIELVEKNNNLDYILRNLENGLKGINNNIKDRVLLTSEDYNINVRCSIQNNMITSCVNIYFRGVLLSEVDDLKYAIYLLDKDNNVLKRYSYQKKIFETEFLDRVVRIKLFVRDTFGRQISVLSNKFA